MMQELATFPNGTIVFKTRGFFPFSLFCCVTLPPPRPISNVFLHGSRAVSSNNCFVLFGAVVGVLSLG